MRTLLLGALLVVGCGARTDLADLDPEAALDASRPECLRDEDCHDGVECTTARCVRRECVYTPVDDRCEDDLFCTGPGRCDPEVGCVFPERTCGDGVMCTEDRCDEALRMCVSVPRRDLCPLSHRCDPELGCVARAIVHDNDFLWEVDLPSGSIRQLARSEITLTDISLHPDGRLFGISGESLFRIDEDTGSATFVASLPEYSVALDVTPDGDLVAAGIMSVSRIDPDTGAFTNFSTFPMGFGASGDIAFVRGRMLVATTDRPGVTSARPDYLFEVPPDGSPPFEVGVIGFNCVWGLAPFGDTLYGFTCDSELLEIDPDTGAGRVIAMLSGRRVGGAAAR
ncbi:MAG: hypothetical protein H6719_33225 [Sandaracinaceae bacterium]|nr:hypothetical protein [Sandaracinaceae bacterium]